MTIHIRTSARAIVQRDGKLLVIRYRDVQGDFYALPGGAQQHGESLTEAVVREVAEETGAIIHAGNLRFVRECRGSQESRSLPPDWHGVELFFDCELISHDGQATAIDPGQIDALWLTTAELRQRCFYPQALLDRLECPSAGNCCRGLATIRRNQGIFAGLWQPGLRPC